MIVENIKEIRELMFPILIPSPLKLERQEYLYLRNIIRPLVKGEFRDITCPKPNVFAKGLD